MTARTWAARPRSLPLRLFANLAAVRLLAGLSLTGLSLTGLSLTGPALAAATSRSGLAPGTTTAPVAVVTISRADPAEVPRGSAPLTVQGTVATSSGVGHLHVTLAARGITDRGELAYLRGAEGSGGRPVAFGPGSSEQVSQGRRAGPGHPASFSASVPGSSVAGMLGDLDPAVDLTVTLTGAGPGGITVAGTTHLRLPVAPSTNPAAPPYVSLVIPITAPPGEGVGQEGTGTDLAQEVAPTGRLATMLTGITDGLSDAVSAGGHPAVTLAVDPALVDRLCAAAGCAPVRAQESGVDAETASEAAALRGQLIALARTPGVTLSALPYADADLDALVNAGEGTLATGRLLGPGRALLSEELGLSATDLQPFLPAGGTLSADTLALLAQQEIRTVIVDQAVLPPAATTSFTPTAVATVATRNGPLTALTTDPTLQRMLTAAGTGAAPVSVEVEDLLAEEATLAAERPNDTAGRRAVTLVAPRDWTAPASYLSGVVAGLATTAWAYPSAPSDADTLVAAARVEKLAPAANRLSRSLIDEIATVRSRLSTAEQLFPDAVAASVGGPLDGALDRATSSWWRGADAPARALVGAVSGQVNRTLAGVDLSHAASVLVTGSHGKLPIQLVNRLPYPVRLRVELRPVAASRIQPVDVDFPVQAAVDGHEVRVQESLPVVSRSAGRFPVNLQLATWQGRPIAPPQEVRVQSRNYGRVALGITAGALGILLLALLIRAIRALRRRRDRGSARHAPLTGASP